MSTPEDYTKEAYSEGKAAARDGEQGNPHPWGCPEFAAWNLGYADGKEKTS